MMPRSFSHPNTNFTLRRSDTPVDVDGFKLGELTGEVECEECGSSHWNIDEIPHAPDCSQRFVRSEWWINQMRPN